MSPPPSTAPNLREPTTSETGTPLEARRLLAELEGRSSESVEARRARDALPERSPFASPLLLALGALAAAWASPWFHGYGFGLEAQRVMLPLVRALQDPTLFPGDALIESSRDSAGWFLRFLAWAGEAAPRESTFLALHVGVTALRFGAVLAIGRALAPRHPGVAWLALWLVFFGQTGLGSEPLNPRALTAASCASALGAWALAGALHRRWLAAFLVAGAVGSLDATHGVFAIVMVATAGATEPHGRRSMPAGLFLALLLAFADRLDRAAAAHFLTGDELAELVRAFFPAPHFPSTFGPGNWLAVTILGGLVASSALAPIRRTQAERHAVAMGAVVFALWLVGGLWNDLAPHTLWLDLAIFRASALLCVVAFPLLAALLVRLWCRARVRGASRVLVPAALFLLAFPGSAQSLSVTGGEFWLPATSSVILGAAALCTPKSTGRLAGSALVFCTFTLFVQVVSSRVDQAAALEEQLRPWRELQVWAREHTPASARFLTPPYLSGFRVHSERGVVGELEDGRAVLASGAFAAWWRTWFVGFGGSIGAPSRSAAERLARGWFAKDEAQLRTLARHYGADYVVLSRPPRRFAGELEAQEWSGTPVYASRAFRVYEVPRALVVR